MKIFATAIVLAILGALAAPAFAQGRDPFDPRLEEGSSQPPGGGTSDEDPFAPNGSGDTDPVDPDPVDPDPVPVDPDPDADPAPQDPDAQPDSDVFPNTGFDPSTWLAAGLALLTMGAGLVAIARLHSPRYLAR